MSSEGGDISMPASPFDDVLLAMRMRLDALPEESARRPFLSTYLRTTVAVEQAVRRGHFLDGAWVAEWDACFAKLYLCAHDAHINGDRGAVPRPWRLAFAAPEGLPALRHVLLGINAHVNFDLPQALLAMLSEQDFGDSAQLARRRSDHGRIDDVLVSRVKDEDDALGDAKSVLDRVLNPLNRVASRRFLRESRVRVWHNVTELHAARMHGPNEYAERVTELEVLSAARINELLAPGQVLLRLAVTGFGVTLPPP